MDKADIWIECIHCKNFFDCKLKKDKTTDRCINFDEREDLKNEREQRMDKTS